MRVLASILHSGVRKTPATPHRPGFYAALRRAGIAVAASVYPVGPIDWAPRRRPVNNAARAPHARPAGDPTTAQTRDRRHYDLLRPLDHFHKQQAAHPGVTRRPYGTPAKYLRAIGTTNPVPLKQAL